jgi:hypothetical protein
LRFQVIGGTSCPRAEDRKSDKLSKNPGNMRALQFVP